MTEKPEQRVVTIDLSDAELIDLIKSQVAREAASEAKDRLNFFLGLIFATVGLLAVAAGLWINERVKSLVATEVARQLQSEVASATLLPLLVAEANALSAANRYDGDEADRLIGILRQIRPSIEALSDEARWLAYRRIEGTIDSFWEAGDYRRVFQTAALFGDDLLALERVFYLLCHSMAAGFILHPDFVEHNRHAYERLIAQNWQSGTPEYEIQRLLIVMERESRAGLTPEGLAQAFAAELSRNPDFANTLYGFVPAIQAEFRPGAINHTALSEIRYDTLYSAFEVALGLAD